MTVSRVRRRARRRTALATLPLLLGGLLAGSLAGAPAAGAAPVAVLPAGLPAAPAGRVPGTPVAPLPQIDQSTNGGTNPLVGPVAHTRRLGTPDPGVVPVVGSASARADDGAYVAYESRVDARTVDLMIVSPALAGAVPVRLRLPPAWSTSPARTFPSLYLLPGGSDAADYQAWSVYSTAYTTLGATNVLTVMPSLGSTGIATDWVHASRGYQYDTFVSAELPQLLRRGYRAAAAAAVAGSSTGGYSAFALAALHPCAYRAVASYSGVPSTTPLAGLVQLILAREGLDTTAMWGDPVADRATWLAHDPTHLAGKLRGTPMFVSAGNGTPGPLDPPGAPSDLIEPNTLTSSRTLTARLGELGIPVTTDFYGRGTHGWPYWGREFGRSWPALRASLGLPAGSAV